MPPKLPSSRAASLAQMGANIASKRRNAESKTRDQSSSSRASFLPQKQAELQGAKKREAEAKARDQCSSPKPKALNQEDSSSGTYKSPASFPTRCASPPHEFSVDPSKPRAGGAKTDCTHCIEAGHRCGQCEMIRCTQFHLSRSDDGFICTLNLRRLMKVDDNL